MFYFRQEKLLAELSEKDACIADLEMDRTNAGASNRGNIIERLNTEKQYLHNQLKELVRRKIFKHNEKLHNSCLYCRMIFGGNQILKCYLSSQRVK